MAEGRYNLRERKNSGRADHRTSKPIRKRVSRKIKESEKENAEEDEENRIVRGTRKKEASQAEAGPSIHHSSPDEKQVKRPRTPPEHPEQTLLTPRSKNSKPNENSLIPVTPQTTSPTEFKHVLVGTLITPEEKTVPVEDAKGEERPAEQARLGEPAHDAMSEGEFEGHDTLESPIRFTAAQKEKWVAIPERMEIEPEFARVLEYKAPEDEQSTSTPALDILAGEAFRRSEGSSRSSSEGNEEHSGPFLGNSQDALVEPSSYIRIPDLLTLSQVLDMQQIIPGLFLGSYSVLRPENLPSLRAYGVRHIISIRRRGEELVEEWDEESSALVESDPAMTRTFLDIADSPYERLLHTHLLPQFVRELRRHILANEPVFVHCQMGRSRSVTIVIAYLMKYHAMSFDTAFEFVREKRPVISPNMGFLQQLQVWGHIKYSWNTRLQNPAFQHWNRAYRSGIITCNNDKYGGRRICLPNAPVQRTFGQTAPLNSGTPTVQLQEQTDGYFYCGCGYQLAPRSACFSHTSDHNDTCTQIFLGYQMNWMELDVEAPGGKLKCPGCDEWVGEYGWLGLQCEDCGEIVSPGLALVRRGNVDSMDCPNEVEMDFGGVSDDQGSPKKRKTTTSWHDIEKPETPSALEPFHRKQDYESETCITTRPRKRKFRQPTDLKIPSHELYVPKGPSPLRKTCFPRSTAPSQEPEDFVDMEKVDRVDIRETQVLQARPSQMEMDEVEVSMSDDDWVTVSENFPSTPREVLELVEEFLMVDGA